MYFLSLLPNGALQGLLPRLRFRNPFDKSGRRHRRRHRRPHAEPYYHDYDYRVPDYEEEYDYGYHHGPPRDHHHRRLRHGPPIFKHRMVDAYDSTQAKAQRRNTFNGENSVEDGENTVYTFPSVFDGQRHSLVKRQTTTGRAPW